jgi:hypothetical protein
MTHYIPYVNSPELLIKSYESAALIPEVVILDNRGLFTNQPDPKSFIKLLDGHTIMRLEVSLTTAQIMNFMTIETFKKKEKFFSWQHGDVEYNPKVGIEFCNYVNSLKNTDWGIIYTHHDLLAAYNVDAIISIYGWDQVSFPYYFLDNDIASRLDKSDYKLVIYDLKGEEIIHFASSTINSDPYRRYISNLTFPISALLNLERHGKHSPTHVSSNDYS